MSGKTLAKLPDMTGMEDCDRWLSRRVEPLVSASNGVFSKTH
jgi:hypothetical protein